MEEVMLSGTLRVAFGYSSQNTDEINHEEVGPGSRKSGVHVLDRPGFTNDNEVCRKYWHHIGGVLDCFDVVVDRHGAFGGIPAFPNEYRANNFGREFGRKCRAKRNRFESAQLNACFIGRFTDRETFFIDEETLMNILRHSEDLLLHLVYVFPTDTRIVDNPEFIDLKLDVSNLLEVNAYVEQHGDSGDEDGGPSGGEEDAGENGDDGGDEDGGESGDEG